MQLYSLNEPRLQFAKDTSVSPRAGIRDHHVFDVYRDYKRDQLQVGAVSTSTCLEILKRWLDRCRSRIDAPDEANTLRHPAFPGFSPTTGFKTELVSSQEGYRSVPESDVEEAMRPDNHNGRIQNLTDLYLDKIDYLAEYRDVDVIICVIPKILRGLLQSKGSEEDEDSDESKKKDFRRLLKARSMYLRVPLQLIWEENLKESPAGRQNDATRAWNFMTALYYKGGNNNMPWRIPSNNNRPDVCHVGVGFYETHDEESLHTSMAQIFDEMGRSVILRGNPLKSGKDDRRPYLDDERAYDVLSKALNKYRQANDTLPGRIALHKSSAYRDAEIEGFKEAINERNIAHFDLVTIRDRSNIRLYRNGKYPPYRGTAVHLERNRHLLYTNGSIRYYYTHPGPYIPKPIEIIKAEGDSSMRQICREILSLTKVNWNNTRIGDKKPITLECSKKIGDIMKHIDKSQNPDIHFRYYM